LSPVTLADHAVDGGLQLTFPENAPEIVTRRANSCRSVPLTSTGIDLEHATLPEIVATPVLELTVP
jgi:hypothetical protein